MAVKLDSERLQIARIAERLAHCHPEISTADMHCLVQSIYARFVDAQVRDFIPLLVERRAREQIAGEQIVARDDGPGPRMVPASATTLDFPVTDRFEDTLQDSPMSRSA